MFHGLNASEAPPPIIEQPPQEKRTITINQEWQQRILNYKRAVYTISIIASIASGLILAVSLIMLIPYAVTISDFIMRFMNISLFAWQPVPTWYPVRIMFYYDMVVLGAMIFWIAPIQYLTGFWLARRHHIHRMAFADWLDSTQKRWTNSIGYGLFYLLGFSFFLAFAPQTWFLWCAGTYFVFTITKSYFSPVWSLKFSKYVTAVPEGPVTQCVAMQAQRAGIHVKNILVIEKKNKQGKLLNTAPNAYASGWGSTRSILLTGSLLRYFSSDEIEAVLAHEIGHHVHHDIWKIIASRTFLLLGPLFTLNLMGLSSQNIDMVSLLFISYPVALPVYLLHRYYRRHLEYRADHYALELTGNCTAFKKAMTRLTNMNMQPARQSSYSQVLSTHPALVRRLKHADEFAKSQLAE